MKRDREKRWNLNINLAAPDEHVPDAERNNRTLQDRLRVLYHRLPFKVLPRAMIGIGCLTRSSSQNVFPKKDGISEHYAPEMIVNKRVIDFSKHLKYSFGDYGQASYVVKPKSNNNIARTIDAIYLRPALSLQEGHDVMDLATGRVVTRPKWTPCKMTKLVIRQVEELARKQGIKSLKFYNRKRERMVPTPIDLIEGVGGSKILKN